MRKGTYSNKDLSKGHIFTIDDVIFLRPKGKVEPFVFYKKFLGKKLLKNLSEGEEIELSHIAKD